MIGQTVSHYRVLALIGSGGMGVVYEAEDLELGRHVALKFLSTALSTDPQAVERFRREARAASALNHPHICTIHDFGVHEGQPFLVMELLQGQTLRQIPTRPLRPDLLLSIAIQVAGALEAAHASGFVHRDIKPANVFLTQRGEAKLLDFGLAKLVRERPSAPGADTSDGPTLAPDMLTRSGIIVGTIAYMSPEQMRGEELDGRTDLFSFGALLYELATGNQPFAGKTDVMVSDAILHQQPAPPSGLNPDLNADLERIIRKALEKDRNLRYQSAADMRADLERVKRDSGGAPGSIAAAASEAPGRGADSGAVAPAPSAPEPGMAASVRRLAGWRRLAVVGAGFLLLVALALGVAYRFRVRAPVLTERDSILVADFDNTTGEAVFDDTLKQALTVQLQQSPFLSILTAEHVATTLRLMGRPPDQRLTRVTAREVCQREGAKAMLVGSIARLGANYVITLEGVNCVTGDLLTTVQGEARGKEEVLKTVASTSATLRARLGETLPSIQKYDMPMRPAATTSLEAAKLFSTAMRERDKGDDAAAVPLLERAVELDPDFALAWAHLGSCLMIVGRAAEGMEATSRAFAQRDRAPEQERYFISYRYYVHAGVGDLDKAIETSKVWATVYPRNWMPHYNLCTLGWQVGDTERALAECREALRLEPGTVGPYVGLAVFNLSLGRLDDARSAATALLQKGLSDELAHTYLADIAWVREDSAGLQQELQWLRTKAPAEYAAFQHDMDVASGRLRSASKTRPIRLDTLAFVGKLDEARKRAEPQLRAWEKKPPLFLPPPYAATAIALAGDGTLAGQSLEMAARLAPNHFVRKNIAEPCIRAALALSQGNGVKAVELLEPVRRYRYGSMMFTPTYLRGLAFLQARQPRQAAAEFDFIIAHRGIDSGSVLWPLAHFGLARAHRLAGGVDASRTAYERFLNLWKDADQDLPVLQEAKREYEKLGPARPAR